MMGLDHMASMSLCLPVHICWWWTQTHTFACLPIRLSLLASRQQRSIVSVRQMVAEHVASVKEAALEVKVCSIGLGACQAAKARHVTAVAMHDGIHGVNNKWVPKLTSNCRPG